jgi:integrase
VLGHRAQHRSLGVGDPIDHDTVRRVRRGLRRIIGRGARRPARPLSVADVRQIVTAIDRTTVRGIRDTAILLLGFAGALRRSELATLTLADVEAKPGGVLLHLRRSKTDQEARGQVVGIAHGHHALTDPIGALDAWLALRGGQPGLVFTSLRGRRPSLQPISGNAVSNIVKERAAAAGLTE